MKKIITILLALVMSISTLTACGSNTKEIEEELRGIWSYDKYASAVDEHCHQIYKFDGDGNVESSWVNDEAPSKNSHHTGTYKIEDKKIIIEYSDDAESSTIEYSHNNGNLKLFDKGDGSLEEELTK